MLFLGTYPGLRILRVSRWVGQGGHRKFLVLRGLVCGYNLSGEFEAKRKLVCGSRRRRASIEVKKMNIEAFLLCDCATQDRQGKLNVLGAFDNIFISQVPYVHPACTVAGRIRFSKIEEGDHKIQIDVIDEDGKEIGPKKLEGHLSVRLGNDVSSGAFNFILNFQRIKFENFGQYRIDLAIDGRQEGALPFYVRKIPKQR